MIKNEHIYFRIVSCVRVNIEERTLGARLESKISLKAGLKKLEILSFVSENREGSKETLEVIGINELANAICEICF